MGFTQRLPFFAWHNDDHHHSGLALFTPAEVFYGRVAVVAAIRQVALDAAYAANPARFPNGRPRVRLPPAVVAINPIVVEAVVVAEQPAALLTALATPPPPSSGGVAVAT